MSIFPGTFLSLPGVSCDRFSGQNLNSDQFFLSHCHSDHMVGLENLVTKLRSMNKVKVNHRIYCSMISKAFIVRRYPYLDERWVRDLFPNEPLTIHVFDRQKGGSMYQLRVIAIPANHCPGSVMFRFETLNSSGDSVTRRILYTGDFRFEDQPLTSLVGLHSTTTLRPLDIDEMYLDTTFCHPQYLTFPKRDEALRIIWELVHSWIRKNGMYRNQRAKHVVLLHLPAQYGSEAILRHIYEMSGAKWRIHVDPGKFNDYLCSDDLGDCTDADPELAQWIHACSWDRGDDDRKAARKKKSSAQKFFPREIPCQRDTTYEVRQIKPSAMFFNRERMRCKSKGDNDDGYEEDGGVRWHVGGQYYRVCYSCHSSLTELMEFVKYFRPKKVYPSVKPFGMNLNEVNSLLESAMEDGLDDVHDSPVLNAMLATQIAEETSTDATLDRSSTTDAVSVSPESPKKDNGGASGLKRNVADINSSDDDDFNPTAAVASKSRRLLYQGSKNAKISASMPAERKAPYTQATTQNRRASLPHNLKIPAITITPSSPSPDPNHPDYPEFFQDRFYLETVNKCSGSSERPVNPGSKGVIGERAKEVDETIQGADTGVQDSSSLEICYEKLEHSLRSTRKSTPEMVELSSDSESDEHMQSTPELDVIASTAATDVERENCSNYAKGLERQRRKTLEEEGEDKQQSKK